MVPEGETLFSETRILLGRTIEEEKGLQKTPAQIQLSTQVDGEKDTHTRPVSGVWLSLLLKPMTYATMSGLITRPRPCKLCHVLRTLLSFSTQAMFVFR